MIVVLFAALLMIVKTESKIIFFDWKVSGKYILSDQYAIISP